VYEKMKRIFLLMIMNRVRHPFFKILVFFVLCEMVFIGNFGFANTGNQSDNTNKTSPPTNSLAWQLEELTKWLIQTRHQTLNGKTTEPPFYVLNSLKLTGSVEKNRLSFRMKGNMISEQPILVPLFGPPDRVILTNITINNQPAVVGFEKKDYYFVRTKEKDFTINGEISLITIFRPFIRISLPNGIRQKTVNSHRKM
jgi:hypothetical protein